MKKKVLFFLFAILLLFVVVLLFFLLKSSNIQDSVYYQESKVAKKRDSNLIPKKSNWTKKLSTYKKNDYLFPVTEFFLTMKFKKRKKKRVTIQKKERYYELVIPDMSNYSLFCILQIFNRKNISYVIENSYENSKILVKADKKSSLERLSDELKRYDIFPQIQYR